MRRRALSERALIGLLGAATAAGPVALNSYLPLLPLVQGEFGVSVARASLTVTTALAAFAIGLLAWGPLSDQYGRRPILITGLGINLVGSLLALIAPSIGWLTVGRVVQALGSAAGVTVARATIGDLFGRERMAGMIAYLTMVMLLANSLAPVIGGALAELAGWRAVFVLLAVLALPVWYAAWRYMPETRDFSGRDRSRPLAASLTLLRSPGFVGLALVSGAIYAEFFVFVSLMPYVFKESLGHSTTEYGLWYLWIAVGYFAGNLVVTRYAARIGIERLMRGGIALSALGAIGAHALAWGGHWQPIALFGPWLVIAFGQGLSLPALTASAVAHAPTAAGAAAGMLGFAQQILGALAVQAMSLASIATPLPVTGSCALIALAGWIGLLLVVRLPEARVPVHPR